VTRWLTRAFPARPGDSGGDSEDQAWVEEVGVVGVVQAVPVGVDQGQPRLEDLVVGGRPSELDPDQLLRDGPEGVLDVDGDRQLVQGVRVGGSLSVRERCGEITPLTIPVGSAFGGVDQHGEGREGREGRNGAGTFDAHWAVSRVPGSGSWICSMVMRCRMNRAVLCCK